MSRRDNRTGMKVITRFVYNPEKADQGLKAMADILAGAIQRANTRTPLQVDLDAQE